MNQNITK